MLFMPIIFLVFSYNYASALALYWTTQNIFSIVQLYLTRNKPLPTLEKKSVVAKREAAAAQKKKEETRMSELTPREVLDTILGYLGFVFEIEEQERDGHLVLQILTHEADRLIGPGTRRWTTCSSS